MVLDATGHARKLVEFDAKFDPGYQVIAASSSSISSSTARVLRCLHHVARPMTCAFLGVTSRRATHGSTANFGSL